MKKIMVEIVFRNSLTGKIEKATHYEMVFPEEGNSEAYRQVVQRHYVGAEILDIYVTSNPEHFTTRAISLSEVSM